ncbi:MAG: putative 4-hydroxybenzoate polyprenyltransferase [Bacteroidetes bacterium]|nr:putative 4-hydroxybenzoate polyprenyltransferase [Bacteroidota bacterium]
MIFHKGSRVSDYFSLVKISHTVFSLPFALIGFSLAIHETTDPHYLRLLILVLACVFFARNAAMGFNRFVDRDIDRKNPRTALREIPKEIIRPGSALLFVLLNAALFLTAAYLINLLCFFLAPVALLVVMGYSFTKRFTFLSHLVLGLGLSLAPIGAYLSVTGHFAVLPVIYSLIVVFWVAGFDIIYALQDVEFDKTEKLRSIPESFGNRNALRVSAIFHFFAIVLTVFGGIAGNFHYFYWIGAVIFSIILIYEHLIVKPDDLSRVNLAFATLNGMGSVVFAVFVMLDIFIR